METFIETLHQKAKKAAEHFRRAEWEMISILQEIEEHRVYVKLGYASLYAYALEELRLSETNAYAFIAVARKAKEVPLLKTEIEKGEITISKAKRLVSVLQPENAALWLEKAKALPKRLLEREIAEMRPETMTPVGAHYVTKDRLHLELGVSEELMDQLVRIQDLLSQKRRKPVSLEEALEAMSQDYLERHDPVQKASRAIARKKIEKLGPGLIDEQEEILSRKPYLRESLKQWVKHQVIHRDQGRCAYVHANGKRCKEGRWLELHHRIPVAQGGPDTAENLITLCFRHHRFLHEHRKCQSPDSSFEQGRLI